ncbi:MAG: 2-oxoacid:acceptor oxidoreductase subunit alpha [Candidatus Marinimicrobia bacterium]|nr:2-oxoacid:acceptor oxidoreductase subunit alpha [Candidatus Neomarinimicrobiota bacterium]MDD4961351.1 2-oxoacid:acceptor oxidoreductase subunit alpha [Candidatus Neomarinimicrobiota bacterium]MDD5709011.1 2-oxoacid:acceptor oxidoreductase subunit alpha [Candidatus Neomarinimicrobiota bacterium]
MNNRNIVIGIAGSGGDGVVSAGEILVNAASSDGLFVFMLKSFGAQIRGGESSVRVRISDLPVQSQGDRIDVMVVLSWSNFLRFKSELLLQEDAVIVSDTDDPMSDDSIPLNELQRTNWYKIPFSKLATEQTGSNLAKNIVMLGAISELFTLPKEALNKSVKKKFKTKTDDIIESNIKAMQAGIDYVREHIEKKDPLRFEYEIRSPRLVMQGNEAVAMGAIYAGLEFYAGYPITPSTEIMEWISRYLPQRDGITMQMEDELASINAIIGASFAGRKAMTATSGPGISLMTEGIGLASMAEIPVVIINVQRGGPSTGLPTKTEQADLMQAIWGSTGDSARVVIAPCDVEDCFDCTVMAFYISEKYQMPVIVLSDQFIAHRTESVNPDAIRGSKEGFRKVYTRDVPDEEQLKDYRRYQFTESGVSPMSFPGIAGGEYHASGLEHDERGYPRGDAASHQKMTEKRWKKFEQIKEEFRFERFYGPLDAQLGVIAWGSTKGAVKEAVNKANAMGIAVGALIPQLIYPFLLDPFNEFMKSKKRVIIPEMSFSGQFKRYLRGFIRFGDYGVKDVAYAKAGGSPFTVEEILNKIIEEWKDMEASR